MMLNRVTLVGRLTKEPELSKTNSKLSVVNFDIAVDNVAKDQDGERGTCFIECKIFGKQAEALVKYTRKGSKVALDGSLNQRNFTRQDGSKGHAYYILVDSVEFLDSKPVSEEQEAEQAIAELPNDDLPFNGEEAKFDPYTGKPLTPKAKK